MPTDRVPRKEEYGPPCHLIAWGGDKRRFCPECGEEGRLALTMFGPGWRHKIIPAAPKDLKRRHA